MLTALQEVMLIWWWGGFKSVTIKGLKMYHNFKSKNGLLGMYTYLKEKKIFYFAFFQRTMYFHITTIKIKLFPFAESLKVPHPGSKLHSVHSV